MWVVKIGGSLTQAMPGDNAPLQRWLELLTQLGGGRVAIVPGGGGLADNVRKLQARWHFDDVAAHNMAVLAMAQNAYLMRAVQPSLQLASSEAEIRLVFPILNRLACLARGGTPSLYTPPRGGLTTVKRGMPVSFAAEAGAIRSMGRQAAHKRRRSAICSIERDPIHG